MRGITLFLSVLIAAVFYAFVLQPGTEQPLSHKIGTVVSVNNERVTIIGSGRLGDQQLSVELKNGQQIQLQNLLTGALRV